MKPGTEKTCPCAVCERPRILRVWHWGIGWRTIELSVIQRLRVSDLFTMQGPAS